MRLINLRRPKKNHFLLNIFFNSRPKLEVHCWENYPSSYLKRAVRLEIVLPPGYYEERPGSYPLLILNDGQDLPALQLLDTLSRLYQKQQTAPFLLVAVHAGDRMQEYGTAGQPDYKKRGAKAQAYTDFILQELIPQLERRYRVSSDIKQRAIAGCSLGGLSALDIAWKNSEQFGKVGVFSGSLWWRSTDFDPSQPDANRIPQVMVETGTKKQGLQFWFQAGTEDETSDRNHNGIIDAIDDTLQLMDALEALGYDRSQDMKYVEVKGGKHHPQTWGKVMPAFLKWAFPGKRSER
jgi:enterochelin esterase-like enzyme